MTNMSIIWEKPFVSVVSEEFWSGAICFSCFCPLEKPRKCSRCCQAWYCSEKCQIFDWNSGQHKNECRVFRLISAENPDVLSHIISDRALRAIARIFGRKIAEKSLKNDQHAAFAGGNWPEDMKVRKLDDLCCHLEFELNDVEVAHDIEPAWMMFQTYFAPYSKLFQAVSFGDFAKFAGLWLTNNLAIEQPGPFQDFQVLGAGLFLQTSRFDHTCTTPDLVRFFRGNTVFLKVIDPNMQISGSNIDNLKINYMSNCHLMSTICRREHLMGNYLFVCKCPLCSDQIFDQLKFGAISEECATCKSPLVIKFEENGLILSSPNLAEIEKMVSVKNQSAVGEKFCLCCQKSCTPSISPRKISSLFETLKILSSVTESTYDITAENCAEILLRFSPIFSSSPDTLEFHPVKNATVSLVGVKILAKYQLYTDKKNELGKSVDFDSLVAAFIQMGLRTVESFEIADSYDALQAISCCHLGKFLLEVGKFEMAKEIFGKGRNLWAKVTNSDCSCVLEVEKLLSEHF